MQGAAAQAGLHTADGRQPRVAVVDSNPSNAAVTGMLVEQFGCLVLRAPTGEAALAMLRHGEQIDLVLIDLDIKDMDGIVAALLMRAVDGYADTPIVPLVSGPRQVTARGRAAGFARALVKPFSPRELFTAMSEALARAPRSMLHDA